MATFEIKKQQWNKAAAAALRDILGDNPAEIIGQIESGLAELWHFSECGYVITRVEKEPTGQLWLVLVAGSGCNLKDVLTFWQRFADSQGFFIRIHSERAGMLKMLKPFGFTTAETIYTYKGEKHGRQKQQQTTNDKRHKSNQ